MTRKLIMDVDTGTDDAVALMFAALHPDLDLMGVTTVNGNVPLDNTTDNTLRVLDWIGCSGIPVHPGLSRPIVRTEFPSARHFVSDGADDPHGKALDIPAPSSRAQSQGGVEYLIETLRAAAEPVTLVAVGPLSNIAAAIALDPELTGRVDEIVIMGGGHATANVTASAEFNIWADPEATAMVLAAGFPKLTLVTLDATHRAGITRDACRELAGLGTPAGTAAARFVGRRIDAYSGAGHEGVAPVHDVVCAAYLVRPDVVGTSPLPVAVETAGAATLGRTVIDVRPDTSQPANAHVALDANAELLTELLIDTFARTS
ncbi:nucleoside hydrolase [Prauserella rugosa]|uniref:Purine nucleosidase/ribosylpyrimidine nucleosidase n=1 Tax=Prauserella rugosa TaxID=43354 RepID=A0A660CG54_9PSEU|nr:nucleoside hydrolase [Prauserella rugosa]KMS86438.1 nucleoside hydrolase [Streptomyces regensis]TWH22326.1 purine nucleosidase/ribosylpyrimidine nucleosidase [Prauserella rugosa]